MPRFFLNIRDGNTLFADPEGTEFPDLEAAHHEALAAARSVVWDNFKHGQLQDNRQYEITDQQRNSP